jgi:hypothetical protein
MERLERQEPAMMAKAQGLLFTPNIFVQLVAFGPVHNRRDVLARCLASFVDHHKRWL